MGFYLELSRDSKSPEYRENFVPFVYLGLVIFSVFALLGMGLAAHTLLADLLHAGSLWDRLLVFGPIACLPVLIAAGIKLIGMRKFVRFEGETLSWGYRLFGRPFRVHSLPRTDIRGFHLENHRPKSNLAPVYHDNPAYFVRGHWRLIVTKKNGGQALLDRHTEREALLPLHEDLTAWLAAG